MTLLVLVIIAISTSVFIHVSMVFMNQVTPYTQVTTIGSVEDGKSDEQKVKDVEDPNETRDESEGIERKGINDCSYICPLKSRVKVVQVTS